MSENANKWFYGGQAGGTYGWGICNRHLIAELGKLTEVEALTEADPRWRAPELPGNLFTPVGNHELAPLTPARGRRNFAYTFFEAEPNRVSVENARRFDVVFAGSSWCVERLQAHGIANGVALVQGVDAATFHPRPRLRNDGKFRIFSGGKLELRKGQDLVVRAFRILHRKYPDMVLVNAWYNQWPQTMAVLAKAPDFRFELVQGTWVEQMAHVCRLNGIDPERVITLPLLPHAQMADVYADCDIGVFPNRCEGGTNLVLMEFMACGRPAIATHGTGHRDVLSDTNALLLKDLRPLTIRRSDGSPAACWVEPTVDEIVAQVERAYHDRAAAETIGQRAADDMKQWTWERAARAILAQAA